MINKEKISEEADFLSMRLASRVINGTLNITEAMDSLIEASTLLLARILPQAAFNLEYENAKALTQRIVEIVNEHIRTNPGTSTAGILVALNLVAELVMEEPDNDRIQPNGADHKID